MLKELSKSSISIVIMIALAAAGLSLFSYQYSTATANQILELAAHEMRSNTEIQAQDLAAILANKVETVVTNLQVMTDASSIQNQDIQNAVPLFTSARESTADFASSYFWVDRDGTLLWADAFTNKTIEQQYNGGDRSNRDYYLNPKETLMPYYTTVIESVDSVPRLYISYPIIRGEGGPETFRGVLVAAIDLPALGNFVKDQLRTGTSSTTGLLDRNGIILYSSGSPEFVAKNVFGPELQSAIPADLKEQFNNFIRDSLTGRSGIGEFSSQGLTSTIAYQAVTNRGIEFAILYVVTPHELAANVVALVDQQRAFNTGIIVAIGAGSAGLAALVLGWNKKLKEVVDARTSELRFANESLSQSNMQLQTANKKLAETNTLLAEANEQLKMHDKMQSEFINVAAHELRTPVQPLLGIAEQLEDELGDGASEVRISKPEIEIITRNAKRLTRLASDILEVSRIEGNKLKLKKEKIDLHKKIETVIEDTRPFLEGKNVSIVFEPALAGSAIIDADKSRLFEVLSNLLRNAIKFTDQGTITVRLDKKDGDAVISLKDTGRGIDSEIMPRLFTKFATRSETGTGLGLYISKNIVEAHGGKIWAENNTDGKGATFRFTLPMETADQQQRLRDRETHN